MTIEALQYTMADTGIIATPDIWFWYIGAIYRAACIRPDIGFVINTHRLTPRYAAQPAQGGARRGVVGWG